MKKQVEINDNITFAQYYANLDIESKNAIKAKITEFISESHFYNCTRNNKFNKRLRRDIEQHAGRKFNW